MKKEASKLEVVAFLVIGENARQEILFSDGQFYFKCPDLDPVKISKRQALRTYFQFIASGYSESNLQILHDCI